MGKRIRGIIVDLGGVISDPSPRLAVLRQCERDLGLPPGQLEQLLFSSEQWREVSTGKISAHEYWRSFQERLGQPVPPALLPFQYNPFAYELIRTDMLHLVKQLGNNYAIALCSNATFHLHVLLAEHRMWHLFETVVISAYVGMRKPNPDILLLTADLLSVTPRQCLFVDDKTRNTDVAAELGMQVIPFESRTALQARLIQLGIFPQGDPR